MSPLHVAQTFWDLLLVIAIIVGLFNEKRLVEWENKIIKRISARFSKKSNGIER